MDDVVRALTALEDAPLAALHGTRQIGPYELIDLIGHGGMGRVWRARDLRLGREVALKELRTDRPIDAALPRFEQEALIGARLQHPNIVPVHDAGVSDGTHYIVMPLVRGRSLGSILNDGPVGRERAAALVEKIAGALHCAHVQGIIHRDVKPANIVVDEAGEPHLLDFGLSKMSGGDARLTEAGYALGSPCYMAPEQIRKEVAPLSPRTDVHALGVLLYELLTARLPFMADDPNDIFWQILRGDAPRLRSIDPSVPADLEAICAKAMHRDPAQRYASAADLATDLRRFREGQPVSARRVSTLRVALRHSPRVGWMATGAAITALAITGVQLLF